MKYNKNNLDIASVAAKNDWKPPLHCVAFFKDKTVATDSVSLIEISTPKEITKKDKNVLELEVIDEPILITAKQIKLDPKSSIYKGDVEFPKYENIFPKTIDKSVQVNGKYLAKLLTQLSKLNKASWVDVSIHDNTIHLSAGDDNQHGRAILALATK